MRGCAACGAPPPPGPAARAWAWLRAWWARRRAARLVLALPPASLEVLRRAAALEGLAVDEWARRRLEREVTAEAVARAARESASAAAWRAAHAAVDEEDAAEELIARCEAGQFSPEEWRKICERWPQR